MLRGKNDILWKGLLEDVFDDLLRFLFRDADKIFDMHRGFEYLDKELAQMYPEPDKKSETRFVDKLVKAYLKDGDEQWVLVHVEVQGEPDPNFAERMFRYYCRIYDRHKRPPTAVAIFTGRNTGGMPDRHERSLLGSELTYKYNTIHLTRLTDAALTKSSNPFAFVLLAARWNIENGKALDFELSTRPRLIVKLLIERKVPKKKIEAILSFLQNYLRFADPERSRIFKEEIDSALKHPHSMNIHEQVLELRTSEAREEGEAAGQAAAAKLFVENLLSQGKLSIAEIAAMANVSPQYVNDMKAQLQS